MPGGNIQEGFLGAGAGVGGPELVSRTDRFDSEGGRTGIPGRRISPTTHCASPQAPSLPTWTRTATLSLTLVSSDSLQWGHPLSPDVGTSATSKAGQLGGAGPDGLGPSFPVGSRSPAFSVTADRPITQQPAGLVSMQSISK